MTTARVCPTKGLGVGVGWRPPIAGLLRELTADGMRFSEVVAENVDPQQLPVELSALLDSGVTVIPHGVGLGLAGAETPAPGRLRRLASLADALRAPVVSEHVAFVRAGAPGSTEHAHEPHADVIEAGHLVPAPRTREALDVLCDNVKRAQAELPVPLALENIAATLRWPEDEYDEPDYLTELVERTGCWLLLDVANLYATCDANGGDPRALLHRMPLHRVAYVHIAGGEIRDGLYADTHAHPMHDPVLELLAELVDTLGRDHPAILLERDANLDPIAVQGEFDRVRACVASAIESARPA
ncbi:MAG: DUF692 domain-containing protein [Sciscionella sp.]|nr:DUF692 domain-containing protein [Sciscionella sp.]